MDKEAILEIELINLRTKLAAYKCGRLTTTARIAFIEKRMDEGDPIKMAISELKELETFLREEL